LIAGVWMSLRRERKGKTNWRIPAVASLVAICAYIFANGLITGRAERLMAQAVERKHDLVPALVVANPVPVQFWKREMLWRDRTHFGQGTFSAPDTVVVDSSVGIHQMDGDKTKAMVKDNLDGAAYLFWSRMPVVQRSGEGGDKKLDISDQRFGSPMVSDRFTVSVPLEEQ
jgi:inner membrane protein